MRPPSLTSLLPKNTDRRTLAEVTAVAWEIFSALLFISSLLPETYHVALTPALFLATLPLSAILARLFRTSGHALSAAVRVASWPIAVIPMLRIYGWRVMIAALVFGLMAAIMRRAIYRLFTTEPEDQLADAVLSSNLRGHLIESGSVVGIVGGHILLLFSAAFLRTHSEVNFETFLFVVPALSVPATVAFALIVRLRSAVILQALRAGQSGDPGLLSRALSEAVTLPKLLAYLDFALWFACTSFGVFYLRPGPVSWQVGDAVVDLAFVALFSWGVAFYQRTLHVDAIAPAVERLRSWTGTLVLAEPMKLRTRLLRAFGLPLLFACILWLLSTIGLYRAIGSELGLRDDGTVIGAVVAAFSVLVLAVGGVVARAAQELSAPLTQLANAADRVAHGELEAMVPRLAGPVEVVGLGESVERMRERLGRPNTNAQNGRSGLEVKVRERTAALSNALDELRRTQAALIQGERLASIGELVAGVAHEIYNPLSAIAGAAGPLSELAPELQSVLAAYREAEADLPLAQRAKLAALRKEVDLDASLEDLVGISNVIRRAVDRSVKIVQNLRNFSRAPGEAVPVDLHSALEETLLLLSPRLHSARIEVVRIFGNLPNVVCRGGELNQVFMNLVVNAIQALEADLHGPSTKQIQIETVLDGAGMVEIRFSDNGPGVPTEIERRIFDPFFTTKPRGQGTGLGLSISTEIMRRSGGSLALERPLSVTAFRGAHFVCRLPVEAHAPKNG